MSFEHIDYDVTDGIAELVLDRPDVLNAFHGPMVEEIVTALYDAQTDDRAYVIVLTGRDRAFCSGADVSGMGGERDRVESSTRLWKVQRIVQLLYHGRKPTVAAVNGPALGAGCDFALACDLRVMSEEAYMREQFVNVGLVPGDGGGWLLPRLVGESKAKEFIMTAKDITPETADDLGLVAEVVEDGRALPAARDLAAELRDKPATALRETKALIGPTGSFEDYAQAAIEAQWRARTAPEHEEAVSAVREGREPEFDREY